MGIPNYNCIKRKKYVEYFNQRCERPIHRKLKHIIDRNRRRKEKEKIACLWNRRITSLKSLYYQKLSNVQS